MHPALILLMTIATTVGGKDRPERCAAEVPELIDEIWKCPEPIISLYLSQESLTASIAERRAALRADFEIYPYYKNGEHWKEGNTELLPRCYKNSDCQWADDNERQYTGICHVAVSFWTSQVITERFCFIVKKYHSSEYYILPNISGLKFCQNNVDCADSKHTQGAPYDAWHCDKWQGYYYLNHNPHRSEPQGGVCMRAKICKHPDYKFASRPAIGNSCNLNDHSTCKGAGIASVQSSRPFSPTCVQHTQYADTNLCCQEEVVKCVDGEAKMKNGKFQCDLLVSAAIRIDPGSGIPDGQIKSYQGWSFPSDVLPYYDSGAVYNTDSGRELAHCTKNEDCNFLNAKEVLNHFYGRRGYCYPAKNAATNLVVKGKMFCFATYGTHYVYPKEVGLKYCSSHADCFHQTYYQDLTYNPWMCGTLGNLVDSDYNDRRGVCIREETCYPGFNHGSLTLDGKQCDTDESCTGAGLASVDTANDYAPKCKPTHKDRALAMCCQAKLPSCSSGLNFRPRTNCKSDSDCTKLGSNNELICDKDIQICCDLTLHSYLKGVSFDRLTALLSNQKRMNRFLSDKSSAVVVEFKKELNVGFDEDAKVAILEAHNEIRRSVSNGAFNVVGKTLPAARNMKPLKWNQGFVPFAKTAAIKKCTQNDDHFNTEVITQNIPSDTSGYKLSLKSIGVEAVQKWKEQLIHHYSYTSEESDMIAIPHHGWTKPVLRMIYDRVTEIGCSYTRCAGSKPLPPRVACYYGLTADQEKEIDYVYKIAN